MVVCRLLTLGTLLLTGQVMAESYALETNQKNLPPCSGDWSRSNGNSVYTCSGQVTLSAGDMLAASGAVTLRAAGFSIASATIGSGSGPISIEADWGGITATGSSSFSGAVSSNGNISLDNATIAGSLTGRSPIAMSGGSVGGDVSSVSGSIRLTGVSVTGAVIANSGSITLSGGSVAGLVNSDCCDVVTTGTNLQGGARSGSSSLSITGGAIQGDFSSNNAATFNTVTMVSGTVLAGSISFTDSTVGSSTASVTMTSRNNAITLSGSLVYGDLTAPNYSTVNVSNGSAVYGTCRPNSTPANACKGKTLLLSWWLNEGSWSGAAGEVLDRSGNNLNGQAYNGASTAATTPALATVGGQGTCRYGSFTAASRQYVQAAHSDLLSLQQEFTIGVWVRPRTLPASGLMSILSKDENYEFHLRPDGTVNWWWQTTGPSATREFSSTGKVTVGQWNHVVIRYTAAQQSIYINGAVAGQASLSGTPRSNNDPLQLGWDQLAGRYFDGDLDELRIYQGALSNSDIAALATERHVCSQALQCVSDDFDRSLLGTDWVVSSRGLTGFTPAIIGNRLRLTSNQGNVATASALQRLFPGEGNFIQAQFKYYAYNGNGADGIALILSDATQTPQPGGYGGSLGYAQLNSTSGFAGGWLGIALDEYGNFSNPTENRQGGPGLGQDSVSIRGPGSGTSGYRYLAGTPAGLNPGVDSATSSSAAPGHTYRITIDARTAGKALVTVERDTGSGFVVLPGLESFDALAASGQTSIPENLYLSLTGSTGGSNNVHEIDDLQVCASEIKPIGQQIHHFDLNYSTPVLTCNPQEVIVTACLNADCSQRYTDPVKVTLTATDGAVWQNGSAVSFTGGQGRASVQITKVGEAAIGVGGSTPSALSFNTTTCSTAGCKLMGVESGFIFDVPTLTAAKPQEQIAFRAVKADPNDSLQCIPGFDGGTRNVAFSSTYANPATGTQPVIVNGQAIGANATEVPLSFDSQAVARLSVRYDDAGLMALAARYAPTSGNEAGMLMHGSDQFVSKPYGLCIQTVPTAEQACTRDDTTCPLFSNNGTIIRAGDPFPVSVRAVGWQSDGEALTADQLCVGNITTPNFELVGIALTSELLAPASGETGTLSLTAYSHDLGVETKLVDVAQRNVMSVSEVGIFRLVAAPPEYFDELINGGTSNRLGRFSPAFLGATGSASLTPSCGPGFSYQGQPMEFAAGREPTLTVTGYNRLGGVTRNYDRGGFWRLSPPAAGSYNSAVGRSGLDTRLTTIGNPTTAIEGAGDGDGSRTYRWSGQSLVYDPAARPSTDDLPFKTKINQVFNAASLTDADAACLMGATLCQSYSYDFVDQPGSVVRLGRLSIGNGHGSELQSLVLPLTVESWQATPAGPGFRAEPEDSCTNAASLGNALLDGFTGRLADGETSAVVPGLGLGVGRVELSAPGPDNDGSVQVSFPGIPEWLRYDWRGAGREPGRGLATFGIYGGSKPLIFRRELYR
ncbi:MAG: hypothetical protein CMK99_15035 [Pseudomonas sp.]|nr:hypothetical protein [Pseudomonas sp.]|tara:strand:+ start:8391 stop:12833 length:4443 start_codon:yes stop_codon:yes gene_type:complete